MVVNCENSLADNGRFWMLRTLGQSESWVISGVTNAEELKLSGITGSLLGQNGQLLVSCSWVR